MNAKHISIIVAVAALHASCAKSPIEEVKPSEQLVNLELSSVNATETKAAIDDTTFPQTGEIGLFLFKDETATQDYGDGYKNVKYSYNSSISKWTASPSIKVGSTPGYLFGYYPYNSAYTDVKAIPVASSLNGDDVMYAEKVSNVTDATASQTSITMNHALARVSIKVINKGYTGDAELSSIKFADAYTSLSGSLDATTGTISGTTRADVTLAVPSDNQTITSDGTTYECLLVPSEVETNKQTVTLTLTIDGNPQTATLSNNNGVIIAQGTKSNITITLSNTGITVQTVSVNDWNVVEVGGHKVTIQTADGIDPNDILTKAYADGSNVIIRASSNAGKHLKCTLPGGKFCPQSKTDNLVYTFTLSNIKSDIAATIGYAKSITVNTLSNNAAWGTASFDGDPYEGETITFKILEKIGKFVEWQDADGKTLSTQNPYSVTLTSDHTLTVKAFFNIYGILSGVFTVERDNQGKSTKAVLFSKGNLYWNGSKYDFESEQYEFEDSWNANHVSHFYWSSTATVANNEVYDDNPGAYDVFFTNKEDFSVGTAPAGIYKSLSKEEWTCLIDQRNASTIGETTEARYAKATINVNSKSITGLILFPDVFDLPESFKNNIPNGINNSNANFNTNIYTVDEWSKLESAGAVFLPAAGYRNRDIVSVIDGYYWSSSPYSSERADESAFNLSFYDSGVSTSTINLRNEAYSIRLVVDY